jgi:hypothetical protein
MSYELTSPCDNCPFRRDVKPYITPARVREIADSLVRAEFPCHKTTKFDDDGEHIPGRNDIHCAGALILLEKMEQPSQMMRICERIGMYDASKLDMDAPVYDDFDEMLAAHKRAAKRSKSTR